jgi:hypothetical protein
VTEVCGDDDYDEVSDEMSDVSSVTTKPMASNGDDFRMTLLTKASTRNKTVDVRYQPRRSISFDLLRETIVSNVVSNVVELTAAQQLSPPTPFADDLITTTTTTTTTEASSATLPRPPSRTTSRSAFSTSSTMQRPLSLAVSESAKNVNSVDENNRRQCRTLPRKCCQAIPPPPQYKGVHFAPGVDQTTDGRTGLPTSTTPPLAIPTEGLPTGPARYVKDDDLKLNFVHFI